MSSRTLVELLDHAAAAGTGGLRFVDRQERARHIGWSAIDRRARASAAWLRRQGVEPGDSVGTVFRTSPAFFDALFGILRAGAVPVPLYPPVRLGRLDEYHERTAAMLTAAHVRLLLAEPVAARLLGETVRRCRRLRLEVPPDDLPGRDAPEVERSPDDVALIQFSSGTTVEPKPVALTHRALLAQVEALDRHWRDLPDASGVSWLPL